MMTLNYSTLRADLKKALDYVVDGHEVAIISRGKSKDVVIMSLEDYNSIIETGYLLSTEANRTVLNTSIKQLETGLFQEFDNFSSFISHENQTNNPSTR